MIPKINFDDIRPFDDSEVDKYIKLLLNEPRFQHILEFIFREKKK